MGEHAKGQGKIVETAEPSVSKANPVVKVYVVCEYGHEDSGTVQAIHLVTLNRAEADSERRRKGVNGNYVQEFECSLLGRSALDTDGPQGPAPNSVSPAAGGVSPLNLDRLATWASIFLDAEPGYVSSSERPLADAVLALVARVRALEAVTQAATMLEQWVGRRQPQPFSTIDHTFVAYLDALRSALAVVDGGGTESE